MSPRLHEQDRTPCASSDGARFFRSWLQDPLRVAAVAPSGPSLARLMTENIAIEDAPILELGPGTGVFTQALVDRGIAERDLTLVEFDEEFAALLRMRFPQATIVHGDATKLKAMQILARGEAGAVISGLGLLSMTPRAVMSILSGAFAYLRPSGAFYQFTYGPQCPVSAPILDRLGLEAERVGGTWRNLPPAAVYRIRRQSKSPSSN